MAKPFQRGKNQWRITVTFEGKRYSRTFPTAREAQAWHDAELTRLRQGNAPIVRAKTQTLADYGAEWITHREIKASTRKHYTTSWRLHISPQLGDLKLSQITRQQVQQWRNELLAQGAGATATAHAYRVLRAILNEAKRDGLIERNPCTIPGAGTVKADERPTLTPPQIASLTMATEPRYKALVQFLAWTGVRIGEATALTWQDIDLDSDQPAVSITRRVYTLPGGVWDYDKPKSAAGIRTVAIPPHLVPILKTHLETFVKGDDAHLVNPDGLLFPTNTGKPAVDAGADAIRKALIKADITGVRVHDLRHTACTLAAQNGATLADLMQMLGHASPNAALRYLHGQQRGNQSIARALSDMATEAMGNVVELRAL